MSQADHIWDELDVTFSRWGLRDIPFTESASSLRQSQLAQVFTGRESELREVLNLFRGRDRRRVLVYGWFGIGKTAFLLEVLGVLRRKAKGTLAAWVSLPQGTDLATAALVALAREMPDDEWAQEQLNLMGLRPRKPARKRREKIKAGISGFGGETEDETIPAGRPQFAALSFEDLLARARAKHERVVIALDDLDKQDPARVRELLRDAQGVLKGDAWFMLTGHPSGLTRDLLTRDLGLFDLAVELKPLDPPTVHRLLVNYLNSARPANARRDPDDSRAVYPFTAEAAQQLCARSEGVPRWINRLASYALLRAAKLQADLITTDVLEQGLAYADQQLRGQASLTAEDYYILELVLEKGILSDESLTLHDLERVQMHEFSEILPRLEKLVQLDLVRRLPSERAATYKPSPLLSVKGAREG